MSQDKQLSPAIFERLLARERNSRKEAERLLDQKSIELYDTNNRLRALADELESRVAERTAELETERNRAVDAAEALSKSERRFSDMADIVGEYLWEIDADYCFTSVTDHVSAVIGYTEGELIGRSIFDYMPPEDASRMRRIFEKAAVDGSVLTNLAHRAHNRQGAIIWQRSSAAPNLNISGEFSGFRGASLDVSERERSKEQMQQLVIALQHASEAIVMTDPEGRIQFANDACAAMFGYETHETFLGDGWQLFYKPEEASRFEAAISTKSGVGDSYSGEGVGLRADGSEFSGHFSFNRLPNGGLLWICRDESERLNTLLSLQTQNSLLSALLENIRIGVVFESATGNQELLLNHTVLSVLQMEFLRLEGVREATALFEPLRERCVDDESRSLLAHLMDMRNERANIELSLDQDTHLEIFRVPVNVGDAYRGALWVIRDVTENKRQAREMEEARLRAESGDRAKSTFLANMSHEIRTPLNGICGMARILMSAALDNEAVEQVRGIQVSADSLLHVLNDILDFSKIEAGQLDIEMVDFDIAHVLDSAFTILQMRAQEKSLRFECVYPDPNLPILRGDSSRLNEILLNLIGNAIKFTTTGSINLTTRVSKRDDESLSLEFTVTDTGIGMSSEEMAHVFEPFSQADSSINRRFGGSGLGLSICRDLIQLMGGSFSVESQLQVGSVFTVELPYAISQSDQAAKTLPQRAFSAYVVTQSDDFYWMCKSMLAYADVRLMRVDSAAAAISCFTGERGVLLLDRSAQTGFVVEEDPDLKQALPKGLRTVVVSKVMPSGPLDDAYFMSYPFSRYKLLRTAYSVNKLRLPMNIFQEYDADSFDGVDLTGLRVLVAEDHIINQKVARLTIERFGATVDLAANGLEVLELVERFEYDLILMDIRMPEMGGVEACLKIREMGLNLPIYAFTADAMKGDRERFMEAGMNGYLSKPIAEIELVNILMRNQKGEAHIESRSLAVDSTAELSPAAEFFNQAAGLLVIDVEDFYKLLGGEKDIAHDLLQQFVGYSVESVAEAIAAMSEGDYVTARSRFHKLAGSAATICAHQVRAYFLSFERSLMEAPPNLTECVDRIPVGTEAFERLCAEIKTIVEA